VLLCRAGVAAAALAVPQQANALTIPSQESYGGLGRKTGAAGSSPKSPTRASMEGCEYRHTYNTLQHHRSMHCGWLHRTS